MYAAVKHIHLLAIGLSLAFFILRGIWMLIDSEKLKNCWIKYSTYLIDTVLLLSAIKLTILIQQYPGSHDWLTAKVIGLVCYIILGVIALKRGKTKGQRTIAFIAALATISYIIGVAIHHNPMSWLS